MNLSEIILSTEQLGTFMIIVILSFSIYSYILKILPSNSTIKQQINFPLLFVLLYILYLITNRIVKTNISFSKPLTKYLINKKNNKEEPYHIKYINPFVTNLDKVDFNMKQRQNKEYIKKILSQLLLRKYVSFENILGYNKNPWQVVKLKDYTGGGLNRYTINDKDPESESENLIRDNMYCMNCLTGDNILVLYRKKILKFVNKKYFIFEKKNKKESKYYFRDCISQVIPNQSESYDTIIDTRDLRYDRQYILFKDFTHDGFSGTTQPLIDGYLKNLKEQPEEYNWSGDNEIKDVIVIDIYFIYNQMLILDEDIMTNDDKKDFSLNKFYERQDWIEKRYFNLIKNQFTNRIGTSNTNVMADKLTVRKKGYINDNATIKFRKIAKKVIIDNKPDSGKALKDNTIELLLHNNNKNELKINATSDPIIIDFQKYIKEYIQEQSEAEANEPVIIKDSNTKSYEDNDLLLDKNTISYVSFNFLNIKTIKEYRNKMNYIADTILNKYYKEEVKSIDKIKFNLDSLQIIQFDKLLRYNKGKSRLILDNRVITPRNIGLNYRDIKRLRESYIIFLEKILKYKKTLNDNIQQRKFSLNVTNNELLAVLNNNPFNTKSKYLAQIKTIKKINSESLYDNLTLPSNKTLVGLEIKDKSYNNKLKSQPLFVKFATTMNIDGFSINPEKVYIVHYIAKSGTLKPQNIYLEESLLETDNEGNTIDLTVPTEEKSLNTPINLFDCTNMFRKETIGVSNLIEILSTNTFKVIFDNVPLEFKPLFSDEENTNNDNMYIDRPTYVMLNYTKTKNKNNIKHKIYENILYKVIDIKSTTSSTSAQLTLQSLVDITHSNNSNENNIFKDVLVSQFINSKNYIENVFFKKVDIPRNERVLSTGPAFKFILQLKNQIINITPEITRADIIGDYENTMNKIIDYIYKNEAQKIHYEIPENIGVYKDISSAVYSYKYKNELYISYEKRNNPVNLFKNYNSEFLCKKLYRGTNYALNMNSLYYLDSYQEYYNYFINLFKNTLGLHDEINYQCTEYYKSGSMLSNLKLPITFNKYVTFSNNYMLYYKTNIKIDDIDPKYLGKHIVINNTVCDNQLLNVQNSNRNNSRLYKTFLKDLIYKHEIGRKGFEYSDAKKICERIFTVYDKNCQQKTYKQQSSNKDEYNVEYFKNNKERDNCFTTLYNDEKEKNTYQFIAESKMLDPTNTQDIDDLKKASDNIKNLKNTCGAKLTETSCDADLNCLYNKTISKCQSILDINMPIIYSADNTNLGYILDTHPGFEVTEYDSTDNKLKIKILIDSSDNITNSDIPTILGTKIAFNKDIKLANETTIVSMLEELDLTSTADINVVGTTNVKKVEINLDNLNISKSYMTKVSIGLKVYFKKIMFKLNTNTVSKYIKYKDSDNTYGATIETKQINKENYFHISNRDIKWHINYMNEFVKNPNDSAENNYKDVVKKIETTGNLKFFPHRLAHLNEIKIAAYYDADWDDIGWINNDNPTLYNKSNLVKIKDKKVMWIDKKDENAVNKGVICYGRKLDQNKLGANEKNEMYNFQMEKIEQNIKDIQKYENVTDFNKEVYSRWNL